MQRCRIRTLTRSPCLWCSRVDHIFKSEKGKTPYIDLLCEAHNAEILKLGYCLNHWKLAKLQDMCEDCSSSSRLDYCELSQKIAFIPWVKQIGMIQGNDEKIVENGEVNLRCSYYDVSLNNKFYSTYFLIKLSWGFLDYIQKGYLITEIGIGDGIDKVNNSDRSRSDSRLIDAKKMRGLMETREIKYFLMLIQVLEQEKMKKRRIVHVPYLIFVAGRRWLVKMIIEKAQEPIKEEDIKVCIEDPSCDGNTGNRRWQQERWEQGEQSIGNTKGRDAFFIL